MAPPRRSPLAANKPLVCPVAGCHRTFFHRPSLYRHKRLCHNMGKDITLADVKHYKKRSGLSEESLESNNLVAENK